MTAAERPHPGAARALLLGAALALLLGASSASARPRPAPAGAPRIQEVRFRSQALGSEERYLVVLPAEYARHPERRYPVIYLLHGLAGAPRDWLEKAHVDEVFDRLVAARAAKPAILVAPDGGNAYWTDHLGGARWGAFVADDVLADVDARFRTRAERGGRAIVGVSMGGHGAMSIGLQHPERFAAVVSVAGALFPEPPTHRPIYKKVWGFPADPAHWRATAPIELMRRLDPKSAPKLYLACGDDDTTTGFLDDALLAHRILAERGIPHELRVNDGGHGWAPWNELSEDWLRFVSRALR
ncbi:MAG: prolyl oligopeptidase family serine peptidase [Deltaproteobacteria bacterium]|nr:prolyl oligopeptidase family serine peptidase [Deltaproteobacteria bacterium]